MVFSNQVGVLNYPAFAKTSYASQFLPPGSQPTTPKFHNYISVVLDTEDKLVPRCFPHFALHVSPHRILDYEVSALGFGPTDTEHFDTEQCKETEADAEQIEENEEECSGGENSRNNLDTERSKSRQGQSEEAGSGNQEDEKSVSGSSAKDCKISENVSLVLSLVHICRKNRGWQPFFWPM